MKRLHFMGIGGVGMAGLAFLLHRAGHAVSGCDRFASLRTRWLEANGIPVSIGHDPAHLAGTDELVVTPAVPADEPERAAAGRTCAVTCRGRMLADYFNHRYGIAVCGSHGKTTTATFTAKLLRALGDDPAWCIGGETGAFPVAGDGRGPFVAEADESDGTLAAYRAKILVVTNVDYDHPEHFPTRADYVACFKTAITQAECVVRAEELPTDDFPELAACVVGAHNRANARAAIEVARLLGHGDAAIRAALPQALAALPDRRFQRLAGEPLAVYTDYAHHPREIACALDMARALHPKRLRVLFQPHRYSRTRSLLRDFPPAFAGADEVVLVPVYAAFEKPVPGGDIADLYAAFRETPPTGRMRLLLARSAHEAWRHAFLTREPGDLVLLLGAGDIIGLVPEVIADCAGRGPSVPPRRQWLGAGSNTWKSDLKTDETYVKTDGPAGRPGATLGIPWMAGIPGTIGGWLAMNAGAFGHTISECVKAVTLRDAQGAFYTLPADRCGFGYRTSALTDEIYDATFFFPAVWDGTSADYLARRRRFPAGTKGSVFKNPSPEQPAGRLLEAAGAKGMRIGGAYVWPEHANVIVAGDGATPSDVLALARQMAAAVFHKTGVRLEPEVRGLDVTPF